MVKWHTKRYALLNQPHQKSTHFIWKHMGEHSHLLVDIKCLSIDPLFHAYLTPNDPLFFFNTNFTNWKYLGALCAFWEIYTFCGNFNIKFANFGLKIAVLHTNWPPFLGIHIKKIPVSFFFFFFFFFFWAPQNDPFFQWNLIPNAHYFRSPISTYASLSYSSAPPGKTEHHFLKK